MLEVCYRIPYENRLSGNYASAHENRRYSFFKDANKGVVYYDKVIMSVK